MRVETYSVREIATFFEQVGVAAATEICECWPKKRRERSAIPSATIWCAVSIVEAYKADIPLKNIKGFARKNPSVESRWKAWARLKAYGYSYSAIGRRVGRDHSSVMGGIKRLEQHEHSSNSVGAVHENGGDWQQAGSHQAL